MIRTPMVGRLRWLKRLALDLPRNLKLAYCLMFDERVPTAQKAALAGALVLVASPATVLVPRKMPLIGELDAVALSVLATQAFISAVSEEIVAEHRMLIAQRRSRFDRDTEKLRDVLGPVVRRVTGDGTAAATSAAAPAEVAM